MTDLTYIYILLLTFGGILAWWAWLIWSGRGFQLVMQSDILKALPTSSRKALSRPQLAAKMNDMKGLGGFQGALQALRKKGMVAYRTDKRTKYWYRVEE
jgi:hypothetical protein